eukprot:maker-scaffold_12-snap-gene-9.6-mRNA-1 protein AED:0.00 eAED:0.00 QI:29/1/1/1/1/1/2/113/654
MVLVKRILLNEKTLPTCEVEAKRRSKFGPTFLDLGQIETSELRKQLEASNPSIWTREGQETNVRFFRPFHDDLGVQQIAFIFCDDLMERVYHLPWLSEFRVALEEIFSALNLKRTQIIRCLLAKLPCGVSIPVHHDTGLWSTKSHRMHVPLVTSSQNGNEKAEVVFKSGLTEGEMKRCSFIQGHLIELNNRAKHAVENNWDQDRIHLIFDYVEEPVEENDIVKLAPGQIVEQTRRRIYIPRGGKTSPLEALELKKVETPAFERSLALKTFTKILHTFASNRIEVHKALKRFFTGEIRTDIFLEVLRINFSSNEDILSMLAYKVFPYLASDIERVDALQKVIPSVPARRGMILGVMKCGTTSLFDLLTQHSSIQNSRGKEPHFFDWKWDHLSSLQLTNEQTKSSETKYRKQTFVFDQYKTSESSKMNYRYNLVFYPWKTNEVVLDLEATPSYLIGGSKVAERILTTCGPNVKFIVILRDPVKRFFSQFYMIQDRNCSPEQKKRRGLASGESLETVFEADLARLSFLDEFDLNNSDVVSAFDKEYCDESAQFTNGNHSYLGRGLYALQLMLWFSIFPRENFHVMLLETLNQSSLEDAFKFLEVPESKKKFNWERKNARSYKTEASESFHQKLRDYYKPHNAILQGVLGVDLCSWSS